MSYKLNKKEGVRWCRTWGFLSTPHSLKLALSRKSSHVCDSISKCENKQEIFSLLTLCWFFEIVSILYLYKERSVWKSSSSSSSHPLMEHIILFYDQWQYQYKEIMSWCSSLTCVLCVVVVEWRENSIFKCKQNFHSFFYFILRNFLSLQFSSKKPSILMTDEKFIRSLSSFACLLRV